MFFFNENDIQKINYNDFTKYTDENTLRYYLNGEPGKEHYKLLSYLSNQINNSIIVDIGTHTGISSLALSVNSTNTVHTFNIIDEIRIPSLKEKSNIHFYIDNMFEDFNKYKTLLLSSTIIMLDIDPHEGNDEFKLFEFLKVNNYKGIVICDDIWMFKNMRDNFWYKIEDQYRYDLTLLGHSSGTGIISFNPENMCNFPKKTCDNWTLVTGYFNLSKCPDATDEIKERDFNYYKSHALSTMCLPYNLVVYCDCVSYLDLFSMRPSWLISKTKFIICNFEDLKFNGKDKNEKTFKEYRKIIQNNRLVNSQQFDARNTPSYYLFCMSRYTMMKQIIDENPFQSTHFAWINLCIERMGYKNLIYLNDALSTNRDKFSTIFISYIPKYHLDNLPFYWSGGKTSMCSGFFTGNTAYMYKFCNMIEDKFLHYLDLQYGHSDEQLYCPLYFENKDFFENYYGDYGQMITNYNGVNEKNTDTILGYFIHNSEIDGDYRKCLDACLFLYRSYAQNKFDLTEHEVKKLLKYTMSCVNKLKINVL